MSNFVTAGCEMHSRRLVDDTRDNVSKNVNIDRMDNCSEVALGLLSTLFVTAVIWALALPFFDVAGQGWMKSWETTPGEISVEEFKKNLFAKYPSSGGGLPEGAFGAMNLDKGSFVNFTEFDAFLARLPTPMNGTTAKYVYGCLVSGSASDGFQYRDWKEALSRSAFCLATTTSSTAAPSTAAPSEASDEQSPKKVSAAPSKPDHPANKLESHHKPAQKTEDNSVQQNAVEIATPPPEVKSMRSVTMEALLKKMGEAGKSTEMDALQKFDLDKDSFAAHGEFLKGLQQLADPVEGPQAEGIFQSLDTNKDSVVEAEEFFKAFRAKRYVSARPEMPTTTAAPSPLKTKALQDLKLNQPPLTFERLTESMGAVSPDVVYEALDTDKNGEIGEAEMVEGAKAFAPPLTEVEAKYTHRGLDINGDGRVVPAELKDTLKVGHLFPSMQQAQAAHSS